MNSKITDLNYDELAARFISDKELSLIIQQNISFVEKHIDSVETIFKSDVEKHIAHRELGSIVYSCLEALLKSVLHEINIRCEKRGCLEKKCKYKKYGTLSLINKAHTLDVLMFLLNARLLGLIPKQIDEINKLNDLRNYVHISKNIAESDKSCFFNKEYAEAMLNYYYEILNQLDLADYYFLDEKACLRTIDDNGFELTEVQIQNDNKAYYSYQVFYIIDKLFRNIELSKSDLWVLKMINYERNANIDEVADYVYKEALYSRRFFENEEEFNNAKNSFEAKLFKCLKNVDSKAIIKNRLNKVRFLIEDE